jgi:hypothetical protein
MVLIRTLLNVPEIDIIRGIALGHRETLRAGLAQGGQEISQSTGNSQQYFRLLVTSCVAEHANQTKDSGE